MKYINKHKGKILLLSMALLLVVYHLLWWMNYKQFKGQASLSTYRSLGEGSYLKKVEGLDLSYQLPGYPSFTGNFAIGREDDGLVLFFWPAHLFEKESLYGLAVYDEETESNYLIHLNAQLSYDEGKNDFYDQEKVHVLKLLEEHSGAAKNLSEILEAEK